MPPVGGDPFIALLTNKGNLLIYHYEVVQSVSDYKRHLIYMLEDFDQDLELICKCQKICPRIKEMTPE